MIHRQNADQGKADEMYGRESEMEQRMKPFFTHFPSCRNIIKEFAVPNKRLSLERSITVLSGRLYWLHFKYITMISIINSCKECSTHFKGPDINPNSSLSYQFFWHQWCNVFFALVDSACGDVRVAGLGVGFEFSMPSVLLSSANFDLEDERDSDHSTATNMNGVRDFLRQANALRGWVGGGDDD